MCALSANAKLEYKIGSLLDDAKVASGAIHFYVGALCNFNSGGYLKLGADTASEKFAGVAVNELNQLTGGSNGDNELRIVRAYSGAVIMNVPTTDTMTIADKGLKMYVNGDNAVAKVGTTSNDVYAGIVENFTSANLINLKLVAVE